GYELLHLSSARQSILLDFVGATGAQGYPDLRVDSLKTYAATAGKLSFVDALYPRDAEPIYAFNSASGDTFAGKPVAVRWLGGPHKVVFLGFPLYYCENDAARQAAVKALADLGEPYAVEEGRPTRDARRVTPNASVVRGALNLPRDMTELRSGNSDRVPRPVLLDAAGRRVLALKPGPNDVSRLAPGVYFVQSAGPAGTSRVLVLR
ncbi:MAG: hypothetical protein R6X13_12380, partial [bacterium]